MDLTGGMLTINSSGTSTIGYNGAGPNGSGNIGVSGGTLTVNGTDQFWFGNTSAVTANVSGSGAMIIGDQFLLSRNGSTVNINIADNGIFNVTNASGTQYNAAGGSGLATITLGGNGIFEQTGSSAINLAGSTNFKFNFLSGSLGQFSILNDSAATLNSYITGGNFEINGAVDTTLSDYMVTGSTLAGTQGTIELAVPEPGTWATSVAGVGALLGIRRFRARKA